MKRSLENWVGDLDERVFVEVNLGTIERNYKALKKKAGEGVEILCVVKKDAYGHGMVQVSKRLSLLGCDFFGVSSLREGIELRRAGIEKKIVVLGGVLPEEDLSSVIEYDLTPVVHEKDGLKAILSLSKTHKKRIAFHLKFDTGMGRLGFMPKDAGDVVDLLRNEGYTYVEGLMSHFSESEKRDTYGIKQIETFKSIVGFFSSSGIKSRHIHMANTGALINYPESYFNMVRLGISLYGSYPAGNLEGSLQIEQAMSIKSRIAFLKEFDKGSFLSYGRTYVTEKRSMIAFVPIGYADGYKRGLSNLASVIIMGKRCPVVGRICMDWTLVDVTGLDVKGGEIVTLLGCDGKEKITASELAEKLNTIPYEIFCGVSKSLKRYYL